MKIVKDLTKKFEFYVTGLFHSNTHFIFHPQYIVHRFTDSKIRSSMAIFNAGSKVLDVGTGSGPYWHIRPDCHWVGLDVYPSKGDTIVVSPGYKWEIDSSSFDGVLCTQVLEHVMDFKLVISEIERVLRPGGMLVISVPFVFSYHGAPNDFHRFTVFAMEKHLSNFQILNKLQLGNYFETMAVSRNTFVEDKILSRRFFRLCRIVFFPILILIYTVNNSKALLLSRLDNHSIFPTGLLFVCQKPIN